MKRDQHPVGPEARRGPACSCCRTGKVRVAVVTGCARFNDPDFSVAVCSTCDRVEPPPGYRPGATFSERRVTGPLVSAPKVPRTTS